VRTPILDLFRPFVRSVSRLYFGLELRGVEHIPARGPLVVVPNHQTFADPVLVTIPIRRRVYYMAWRRLFHIPVLGRMIRLLRAFPVQLDARDPGAVREARRLLVDEDAVVMIFPEGGRSKDGTVGHFHLGAFRLAASLGVPALPVTIAGGHASWPRGRMLPRPARMTITYHPLVHPGRAGDAREAAGDLADRTRAAIMRSLADNHAGQTVPPER